MHRLLHLSCIKLVEEYIPIILPSCVECICLSLSLLTGVTSFKHTPVFGLFMRVCNPKGTVMVSLDKETAIYFE